MRHFIIITICLFAVLLLSSCFSHVDGKIQVRDIKLKLITDIEKVEVFIKPSDVMIQIFPISGIYHFKTPELRFHTPKIIGISLKDNVWDIPDFLIIKHGSKVISVLSCEKIWNLRKDENENSLLKV